jgi:hypothetical protein
MVKFATNTFKNVDSSKITWPELITEKIGKEGCFKSLITKTILQKCTWPRPNGYPHPTLFNHNLSIKCVSILNPIAVGSSSPVS